MCVGLYTTFLCTAILAQTQPVPDDSEWQSAAPAQRDASRPQFVLLLPFDSPRFGEAAKLVQSGFLAAAAADGNKIDVVALSGDDATASGNYTRALALQPEVIIGPLTRPGITEISSIVGKVPTLALNSFESTVTTSSRLYGLSLAMENEATQMAEQIAQDGFKKPLLVGSNNDALSQRLMTAFSETWKQNGGKALPTFVYNKDDSQKLIAEASEYDSVFLTLSPAEAYAIKPLLSSGRPVYGTSLLHTRQPDAALAGIRIVEMPWFISQAPEIQRYSRPQDTVSMESERLYALGIDAYTAAMLLAGNTQDNAMHFRGVTGQLSLNQHKQFVRRMPLFTLPSPSTIQRPQ